MEGLAALAAQGEEGYVSVFSLVHFVAGWLFHLVWVWTSAGAAWVSLFLVASLAVVFEIAENSRMVSYWIWRRTLGRDGQEYRQDSLENSQTDVLVALLGWLGVQLIDLASPTTTARVVMLCAALALLAVFGLLFAARGRAQATPRVLPTEVSVAPLVTAPTAAPLPGRGRVRFVL